MGKNGGFMDEDIMMKKALEMSRRESEKLNKNKNNKMEVSDDSDSSFSDENTMNKNEYDEEEKKGVVDENDLYYWDAYDSDENIKGNIKGNMKKDNSKKMKENYSGNIY